ncbi:MAG: bifunctional adenosylcobinamide kinase/adenosylcobinamide-phosphate guanylyltransferase [Nitrospirota bacterium]
MNSKRIIFITGGARSGKSSFALQLANNYKGVHGGDCISSMRKAYIATAEALDEEMKERIEKHKRLRGDNWVTYEEPIKISDVLRTIEEKYCAVVIDCLTLWLSNLMKAGLNIEAEIGHFISSLVTCQSTLIFIVSNEVGMGIVPENEMARRFRDMAGILNQRIAEVSDKVFLVVAGIPLKIKDKGK